MRIGSGYDVHKLVENRDLIIGGVKIPYELGLLGHSDADVLLHAISDALLGAAALGDIGKHFPDTDPQYKGISSLLLLEKVGDMLSEKCYLIEKIDATIISQAPRCGPISMRCEPTLQRHLRLTLTRLMSGQPPRKASVLPEKAKAYPLQQSVC